MLESVYIGNFRSCHDIHLDALGDGLLLLGRNGVGKTNILKAIQWVAMSSASDADIDALNGGATVALNVKLAGTSFLYSLTMTPRRFIPKAERQDGEQAWASGYLIESLKNLSADGLVIFERDGTELRIGPEKLLKINPRTPGLGALLNLFPESEPFIGEVKAVKNFIESIRYYPLTDFVQDRPSVSVLRQNEHLSWKEGERSKFNPNERLLLQLLDMFLERTESFEELKSLLGANGLNVIDDIKVVEFDYPAEKDRDLGKFYFFEFCPSFHQPDADFAVDDLSFGTRRILRLVTSLLYDGSTVMLIEQPEDGIHPGLLHKLVPMLLSYAQPTQFIIATHSTAVMNSMTPEDVVLVELSEGKTATRRLTGRESQAAVTYMDRDGPLSDYLESLQA